MIIFISSIFYMIQLIVQHSNCLNLIDLQQHRVTYNPKWKLDSRRPPVMYETPYPKKREVTTNSRKYWKRNVRPPKKIFFSRSRRLYEDERDANLKNKIASLVQQTMHSSEEVMKDVEEIKKEYREQQPYKAGFVLSMLKKSRDVVNELFNVAIKHRDEWLALEQLKIFEIIVHTNVDTTHLLKQLIDIQSGREVILDPSETATSDTKNSTSVTTTGKVDENDDGSKSVASTEPNPEQGDKPPVKDDTVLVRF